MKALASRIRGVFIQGFQQGAFWFTLSSILPPFVAVMTGPLILRKVGLENYALLGLATYFLTLAVAYSDFGSYSHLLALYSKHSASRHTDLGNAFLLKAFLWIGLFVALLAFVVWSPRKDAIYPLLALSMLNLVLPSTNTEWYFVARKKYFQLFLIRVLMVGMQLGLTLIWFFSDLKNILYVPLIGLLSVLSSSLLLIGFLGWELIEKWISALRQVSLGGLRILTFRLLPIAATLLITPYFVAYALPWFSLVTADKKLVGAFSIAYRLIIGFSSLVGPFVIYSMPRSAASTRGVTLSRILGFSLLAAAIFWILGIGILRYYFRVSSIDPVLFSKTCRYFSVLLLCIFFMCVRTSFVSRSLVSGQYKAYFLIHFSSCMPVLAFSWLGKNWISSDWVPWLACLPDFFATVGFLGYFRLFSIRRPVTSVGES